MNGAISLSSPLGFLQGLFTGVGTLTSLLLVVALLAIIVWLLLHAVKLIAPFVLLFVGLALLVGITSFMPISASQSQWQIVGGVMLFVGILLLGLQYRK